MEHEGRNRRKRIGDRKLEEEDGMKRWKEGARRKGKDKGGKVKDKEVRRNE